MITFRNKDTWNWIDFTPALFPHKWTLKEGAPDYARKEYEELMESFRKTNPPIIGEDGEEEYIAMS